MSKITIDSSVLEQVRGALAYVGAGNASENPNLAQSTCRQAIWKLDHALRAAALEDLQAEQEPVAYRQWIPSTPKLLGYWMLACPENRSQCLPQRSWEPLYTRPQHMQPLTLQQIRDLFVPGDYITLAGIEKYTRTVEAAHRIGKL